jgi:hypothetical protein
MIQTFEYYKVDPTTWKDIEKIDEVISSTITRDSTAETLGSATFEITSPVGECYIRVYLVTIQNGVRTRYPLGTFLVQTPSSNFDGKISKVSLDAYTALLELKENPPPLGYYIPKNSNVIEETCKLISTHCRAPVTKTRDPQTLYFDFVANTDDTWLSFVNDLVSNADYKLALDDDGSIIFNRDRDVTTMQPVWSYNDDNSSILYPEIQVDRDLYGIPNVVEVICANGTEYYYSRVTNDDENSPTSTVNRGREITHRVENPEMVGSPNQERIDEYAKKLLINLSSLEYTISYTHGYCPVRLGDCVEINYKRAGLKRIKAKVISQSIKCEPGCPVTEKAVFTDTLWEG